MMDMIDMSAEICGVKLKNPLIAASGTFGFGREYDELYDISMWGAVSVKGLTLKPREGNPPRRIAETAGGMLNSVGLQNPGVDEFVRTELPWLRKRGVTVIANVAGSGEDDYAEAVRRVSDAGVDMVELNVSCPNVKHGGMQFGTDPCVLGSLVSAVRRVCAVPLIVKLSPNVTDITVPARAAAEAGADALSLINTLTGTAVDLKKRKFVLANVTGGLSGPAVKPVALRMVSQAVGAVSVPVIGMGGIMSGRDAAEFMALGASAVMVGTANITDPMAGPRILDELERQLRAMGMSSVSELRGCIEKD